MDTINMYTLQCPITREIMIDPTCAMDGFSYERTAIEAWLATGSQNHRSPMTNNPMEPILFENKALKSIINKYIEYINHQHILSLKVITNVQFEQR